MSSARIRLRWLDSGICLGLLAISLFILWPLFQANFIDLDDNVFLVENWRLQKGLTLESLRWAFSANLLYSTPTSEYFQPLTLLSRLLDVTLFSFDPHGHHASSIVLHLAFLVLLYLTVLRLTRHRSAAVFIALIAAVHPLMVEPAAWISARKDLLAGLLSVLVILQFVRHAEKPSRWTYVALIGIYFLAALTKPVVMTLPAVLLLVNFWPLCRWTGSPGDRAGVQKKPAHFLLLELLPLFAIALAVAALAWVAQRDLGATAQSAVLPFRLRLAGTALNYLSYLTLTAWPVHLSVLYPHFSEISLFKAVTAASVLTAITIIAFCARNKYPSLIVGWLWFVITLAPSSGLFPLGVSRMGDRYMYFAIIGLLLMATPLVAHLWRSRRPWGALAALGMLAISLGWRAHTQASFWTSSLGIISRAVSLHPESSTLHNLVGTAQEEEQHYTAAASSYLRAGELDPTSCFPFINLAEMCVRAHHLKEAQAFYLHAARLAPANATLLISLGEVSFNLGQSPQALLALNESLRLRPMNARALHLRAQVHRSEGRPADALADATLAARIEPKNDDFRRTLAECQTLIIR